uniref:Uncharacterized protein n=2 Tax=Parascaris TaxID=6254 RepID=A0A915BKN5_PARUN
MDDKLKLMQDLLDEIKHLNNLTPSICTKSADAHSISDDIIHKLLLIKKMLSDPTTPSRNVMTTYALLNGDRVPNSPLASRKSSTASMSRYLITHAVLNNEEDTDPREVARSAYDSENYAKCIRTIEKLMSRDGTPLESEMMNLCHDSYKKVVEAAATEKERLKLCEWWRLFLDTVHLSESSQNAQLKLIDYKTECLWERQKLARDEADRLRYTEQLMNSKIEAYELAAVTFRPFHLECLRRIQKICALIVDHFERFPESESVPLCIDEGIELARYALDEAKVDAVQYGKETNASLDDPSYLECVELIKEIEMILCENGYAELTHSDADSEDLLSSEDGQEHEANNTHLHTYATIAHPKKFIVEEAAEITDADEHYVTHL